MYGTSHLGEPFFHALLTTKEACHDFPAQDQGHLLNGVRMRLHGLEQRAQALIKRLASVVLHSLLYLTAHKARPTSLRRCRLACRAATDRAAHGSSRRVSRGLRLEGGRYDERERADGYVLVRGAQILGEPKRAPRGTAINGCRSELVLLRRELTRGISQNPWASAPAPFRGNPSGCGHN